MQRPAGVRFIDSRVGIVRQHGVALVGADAESLGLEQRLVIGGRQRMGFLLLPESALAAVAATAAYLQCVGHRAVRRHDDGWLSRRPR